MSQKTDAQLLVQANVIKNETQIGQNTATRVGNMFVDSIDSKLNKDEASTTYLEITDAANEYLSIANAENEYLKIDGANANADIDIDGFSINAKSLHVKGTGGAGHVGLKHQNANITASGNESSIGANSSGNPVWKNANHALETMMTNDQFGPIVNAMTAKTTAIDADMMPLIDSAASNAGKKITWANIKATLKTYFDTLYQVVLESGTNIKTINGTSVLGSGNISIPSFDPALSHVIFFDFSFDRISAGSLTQYTIGTQAGAGQGGALLDGTYTNAVGVYRLTSGTTAASGLAWISPGSTTSVYRPGMCAATFLTRANVSALSTASERYIARIGFFGALIYNANPTNGIFFRYTDNVNSGYYECVCRNSNTETVINTTIAPAISTNWDKLEIRFNAAGTSIQFLINDVSQGSITTNIPTTIYHIMIVNLQKVGGSASQLLDVDYVYFNTTKS